MRSETITPSLQVRVSTREHIITQWLRRMPVAGFTLYTSLAAFCLYTCVYAFRKTFAAASFDGILFAGVGYKIWMVIFQVIGYALSKFAGIKIIAELKATGRAQGILLLTTIAGVCWFLFAIVPTPYALIFLFVNGLSLGMIWGMIFGYLEGRKMTEILGAALSVSFIFSSGLCRTTGAYLIRDWQVSETWMPAIACALFLLPLLLFLYLLDKVPAPTAEDEALRTKREPMDGAARRKFIRTFLPGIILFVLCYILLTIFRDFRDNFSAEVWKTLGYGNSPAIFTMTEIPVSIAVLVVLGSLMFVRNNRVALMLNHIIIAFGMILIGVSTLLFQFHLIQPMAWMTLIGLGLYLGYVPFNSMFFDRMVATFHYVGTVGFIMYVADSCGYLGSVGILLLKESGYSTTKWLDVFIYSGYFLSIAGTILIIGSMLYFNFRHKHWNSAAAKL